MNPMDRFWRFVNLEGECWKWTGALRRGYGSFRVGQRQKDRRLVYAHKFLWEHIFGPVPEGFELDHVCRNRDCVNPQHLEIVTHQVNMLRSPIAIVSLNAQQTHCKEGHEFTPENTYTFRGMRHCRQCCRRRDREFRQKQQLIRKEG
jgi:HNH endonuclease